MEPDQSGITAMCRTMTKTQCRSLFREIDQCRKAVGRINAKDWMQIWQSSGVMVLCYLAYFNCDGLVQNFLIFISFESSKMQDSVGFKCGKSFTSWNSCITWQPFRSTKILFAISQLVAAGSKFLNYGFRRLLIQPLIKPWISLNVHQLCTHWNYRTLREPSLKICRMCRKWCVAPSCIVLNYGHIWGHHVMCLTLGSGA